MQAAAAVVVAAIVVEEAKKGAERGGNDGSTRVRMEMKLTMAGMKIGPPLLIQPTQAPPTPLQILRTAALLQVAERVLVLMRQVTRGEERTVSATAVLAAVEKEPLELFRLFRRFRGRS